MRYEKMVREVSDQMESVERTLDGMQVSLDNALSRLKGRGGDSVDEYTWDKLVEFANALENRAAELLDELESLKNAMDERDEAEQAEEDDEDCCPNCDRPLSEGGGQGADTDFCQECEDELAEEVEECEECGKQDGFHSDTCSRCI